MVAWTSSSAWVGPRVGAGATAGAWAIATAGDDSTTDHGASHCTGRHSRTKTTPYSAIRRLGRMWRPKVRSTA